jgi:hypothetical protein
VERGPQVPLVIKPSTFASRAEGLAGTGACPHGSVIRPPGAAQGKTPPSDSGKKVALCVLIQLGGFDVFNGSFINHSRCNVTRCNKVSQPSRSIRVDFVIERRHGISCP